MKACLILATIAASAMPILADIHDEIHACIHDRLPVLRRAQYNATTAADEFCMGIGYWRARAGLSHDPAKSAQWLAKAAAKGHPGAETVLAYHYEQGHGVAKNYPEALRLLRLAASKNYPDAMFHLGRLYVTGKGVPRNEAESDAWFAKAAAAGSADGIVALRHNRERILNAPGRTASDAAYRAYQAGDYARAAALYRNAANAGSPQAQNNFGTMLRLGQGVPQDLPAAIAMYRQAAAKGYAAAQAQLGFAYEEGEGVKQDWKEAFRWCSLSARQFEKLGLYCLARQYQFGIGVPQDRQRAYRIFDRGEDAGDGMSKFFATWLRNKDNCVGFRSEAERNKNADVCEDPKGKAFANAAERLAWLRARQQAADARAMAAWAASGSAYGQASCSAAGGTWRSAACYGEGARTFDPNQQDRNGRPLW